MVSVLDRGESYLAGTGVNVYPGGVRVEVTMADKAGFTTLYGWVPEASLKTDATEIFDAGEIATLTKEVHSVNLRLEEFIEGVDALTARLESAEKERDEAVDILKEIAQEEPGEGFLSELDSSHMSSAPDCSKCDDLIAKAQTFLNPQQRSQTKEEGEG